MLKDGKDGVRKGGWGTEKCKFLQTKYSLSLLCCGASRGACVRNRASNVVNFSKKAICTDVQKMICKNLNAVDCVF